MPQIPERPILPITIVPLDGGGMKERDRSESPKSLSDLRHWQIEEPISA